MSVFKQFYEGVHDFLTFFSSLSTLLSVSEPFFWLAVGGWRLAVTGFKERCKVGRFAQMDVKKCPEKQKPTTLAVVLHSIRFETSYTDIRLLANTYGTEFVILVFSL